LGVVQAQGYGIARPMAAPRVLDWLGGYQPIATVQRDHGIA
jgi:hypothetical protein